MAWSISLPGYYTVTRGGSRIFCRRSSPHSGGRQLLTQLRFIKFVHQNETIRTLTGGAPGAPPLDPALLTDATKIMHICQMLATDRHRFQPVDNSHIQNSVYFCKDSCEPFFIDSIILVLYNLSGEAAVLCLNLSYNYHSQICILFSFLNHDGMLMPLRVFLSGWPGQFA